MGQSLQSNLECAEPEPAADPTAGLFRTALAGPAHTLFDAFAALESRPIVDRSCRHERRDVFSARVPLAPGEGVGYWDLTRIRRDIYVVIENFTYYESRVERLRGDGLIQFYFKLCGEFTVAVTRDQPLRITKPSLLIYYQPAGTEVREWTPPSAHERAVGINVRPHFLSAMFMGTDAGSRLHSLLANGSSSAVQCFQLPLTAKMFELATELVDSRYVGTLGLANTEAITTQLICAAVANIDALSAMPNEQFTTRELRCFQAAHKLLVNQLADPPNIRDIARTVGLNETVLTHGFKAIYGETIFDFSVRCRMQRALTLLRERRITVAEVAPAVGYHHATSFATAFRRHFGLRPKDVRPSRAP
jgi:AraC-like DNA-binding protein